eukprot:GDKI01005987.1.p1 GENE.GDKI01005987.1~~GDKI01005987.1.p1  ORF type:complete len:148 (-),score=34.51 GDKI01005987.1:559-1002(-)
MARIPRIILSVLAVALSVAMAAANCSSPADQAILFGASTFLVSVWSCGRNNGNFGDAQSCLSKLNLSSSCSSCYADLTQCTRDKCARVCRQGRTTACATCGVNYCGAALRTCAATESLPRRLRSAVQSSPLDAVFEHASLAGEDIMA